MNKQLKLVIYLVTFVLFLAAAGFGYRYLSQKYKAQTPLTQTSTPDATKAPDSNEEEEDKESEKVAAPDFTVFDAEGNAVKLSDFKGTPVVLNFWASWCPPCKAEMPDFNKVSLEYTSDQLQFLMVDLVDGERETVEKGKSYVESNGFTFTVLYDTTQEAASTYGIRSIPSTLFINKDGYIEAGVEGAIDEATLRRGIDLIYEKK